MHQCPAVGGAAHFPEGGFPYHAGASACACRTGLRAAFGVGLAAYLRPAHATRVVVLLAVSQNQKDLLPNRACLFAAEAEQTRRLELAEAVYLVAILDL